MWSPCVTGRGAIRQLRYSGSDASRFCRLRSHAGPLSAGASSTGANSSVAERRCRGRARDHGLRKDKPDCGDGAARVSAAPAVLLVPGMTSIAARRRSRREVVRQLGAAAGREVHRVGEVGVGPIDLAGRVGEVGLAVGRQAAQDVVETFELARRGGGIESGSHWRSMRWSSSREPARMRNGWVTSSVGRRRRGRGR